jgi:ribosome biogenesis protein UTP30
MAPSKTTVVAKVASSTPYQLDSQQTLRATKALVKKIQSDVATKSATDKKESLLADADSDDANDDVPVWLVLTTKKHIVDKKRLKPGKIVLPHPHIDTHSTGEGALRICLITADPQRKYKDLITEPSFPNALSQNIQRVIGVEKLKSKYHSFESKRQLLGEYDVFLADDRVITYLPTLLGKTFYKSGAKRPIPVTLEGRRQNVDEAGTKRQKLSEGGTKVTKTDVKPAELAAEITKALTSALVHLAPSTTTAVKVGTASQEPAQLQANVEAVVNGLIEKFVPQQWRNVRAVHIKGPNTAALPIWLTQELWAEETQVLEQQEKSALTDGKKRKRGALGAEEETVIEVPGADGKMRRLEKPSSKRKSVDAITEPEEPKKNKKTDAAETEAKAIEKVEKAARKEALKAQKLSAKNDATAAGKKAASKAKPRAKAADLN